MTRTQPILHESIIELGLLGHSELGFCTIKRLSVFLSHPPPLPFPLVTVPQQSDRGNPKQDQKT